MLWAMLAAQFRGDLPFLRLKLWCLGVLVVMCAIWAVINPQTVPRAVEIFVWSQFLLAVLFGGAITGWRVTQFPKSRAAEFYLIVPCDSWELVAGELLAGMYRTAALVLCTLPAVAAMWGAGWIDLARAIALVAVPIAFAWMVGIGLACVAYAPLRWRKIGEFIALVGVVIYLVVFGIGGQIVIFRLRTWWDEFTRSTWGLWLNLDNSVSFLNPFRLLGLLGQSGDQGLGWRVFTVVALLLAICAAGFAWLTWRLRWHYLEENYGAQYRTGEFVRPIGDHPLSWWTIRRVSRFKGRINIALGAGTILMFSAWMLFREQWPSWFGLVFIYVLFWMGGAGMLGAFALQFALVPAAFLSGLWDSNSQQRLGRMELLLVTPLGPRDYFWASVAAVWTRAKYYLAMALTVWTAAALAGHITWPAYGLVLLFALNYVVLFFAIAFRNFARLRSERAAATWGMLMSVGSALGTWAIFSVGWTWLAAVLPLGGIFLMGWLIPAAQSTTGLSWPVLWSVIAVANVGYLLLSIWILRTGIGNFDQEIRAWFEYNLVSPEAHAAAARSNKKSAAASPLAIAVGGN